MSGKMREDFKMKMSIIVFLTHTLFFPVAYGASDLVTDDASLLDIYKLSYQEREPGIDAYEVTMLVSERFLRIDESGEDSGYIIYDDKIKTIFSVSHYDKSILVIKEQPFSIKQLDVESTVEYLPLTDAPTVSGKALFNYRVFIGEESAEENCLELQLAEGLLPEVTSLLKKYQHVISGQQVKMLKNTIKEIQTPCYLVDQIYNEGLYYDKGLPVQEWHSNEKSKRLINYKKLKVKATVFDLPDDYNEFSIMQ